jgi:hypothetical protein
LTAPSSPVSPYWPHAVRNRCPVNDGQLVVAQVVDRLAVEGPGTVAFAQQCM